MTNWCAKGTVCSVPICFNSVTKTPSKQFFSVRNVPENAERFQLWKKAIKRDHSTLPVNYRAVVTACEDHFDMPIDAVDYMQWQFMGGRLRLHPHVAPHKFECQGQRMAGKPTSEVAIRQEKLNDLLANVTIIKKEPDLSDPVFTPEVCMEEEAGLLGSSPKSTLGAPQPFVTPALAGGMSPASRSSGRPSLVTPANPNTALRRASGPRTSFMVAPSASGSMTTNFATFNQPISHSRSGGPKLTFVPANILGSTLGAKQSVVMLNRCGTTSRDQALPTLNRLQEKLQAKFRVVQPTAALRPETMVGMGSHLSTQMIHLPAQSSSHSSEYSGVPVVYHSKELLAGQAARHLKSMSAEDLARYGFVKVGSKTKKPKIIKCQHCSFVAETFLEVKLHECLFFICDLCGSKYSYFVGDARKKIEAHMLSVHFKSYRCNMKGCKKEYEYKESIGLHQELYHRFPLVKKPRPTERKKAKVKRNLPKVPKLSKITESGRPMRRVVAKALQVKEFKRVARLALELKCDLCGLSRTSYKSMRKHLWYRHLSHNKYQCVTCGNSARALKFHLRHLSFSQKQCVDPGLSFPSNSEWEEQ